MKTSIRSRYRWHRDIENCGMCVAALLAIVGWLRWGESQ